MIDMKRWLNEEYSIETLRLDVDEIEKAILDTELGERQIEE